MNQKNEIKREDMTYEEFLILCAKLKGNERKHIINPIDSLTAKTELNDKIIKRVNFFEFCINNFLEMHYPISRLFCLDFINDKFILQNDISFDLYDILIQKFFIECQSKLTDETIGLILKIQAQLFYLLYDLEFWMQLFVCEDCCTYMLNNPENQVIGFINCLIDDICYEDGMKDFIKKMAKDGVFDILIKYLFDKMLSGNEMSMDTLCKIFELLDISTISENEIFESFLTGLQEDPARSIKFLTAFFSNGYRNKIILNDKKTEIIDFLEKNDIFNYFNDYLIDQSSQNDRSTISQFSTLIFTIFYPLIPQNFKEEDRAENEFLIPIFENFCPIFFQTLVCLNAIPKEYVDFLYSLSLLLPAKNEELLDILIEKLNVLLTNSQIDFNSSTYMVNYLNLYLSIQRNNENDESEEEEEDGENFICIRLFQRLETGIENLDRTKSFLAVLGQIINVDEYDEFAMNDASDSMPKKVTKNSNNGNTEVALIKSAVDYFDFILNEDLSMEEVGESLYTELVLLYSLIAFKWTTMSQREEWKDHIMRIFAISVSHLYSFIGIVNRCVKLISEDIQKVDDIESIVLNFLSSVNRNLTVCGLNIADQLPLSMQQKDDLIIEALNCVIQKVSDSEHQLFEFNSIIPLFLSTSIKSININRSFLNGGSGGKIDPQIVTSIHDFMMSVKGEMDDFQLNGWITAFLHFFSFIFFDDVRDIYEPIFEELKIESEGENEGEIDFDFEKVTILAGELKKSLSLAVVDENGDSLDLVTNILVMSAKKCELLIKEFYLDESDRIFIENGYLAQRHQNFLEAKDFANEAAEFFVVLFNTTQLNYVYMEVLSFFKMCCSVAIMKSELALFSIFQFVTENDQDSIDEFLDSSFNLIHFIIENGGHSPILFAVARFHKLIIELDKSRFIKIAKSEVPENYLKILFDTTIISDSAFNEKIKKAIYQKRFEKA